MNEGSVHPDDTGLESTGDTDVDAVLALLARGVAALNDHDLDALVRLDSPSTGLHAAARNLELLRRRLAVFDSRYVAAVEVGDEPARYARPSTATFLREQLRLSGGEAKRRVDLAHAITPAGGVHRGGPPGGVSEPGGRASARVRCPGSMPGSCWTPWASCPARSGQDSGLVVEAEMATAAAKVTPADLEVLAREVMVRADPDGTLREVAHAAQASRAAVVEETRAGRVHPAGRPEPGNR